MANSEERDQQGKKQGKTMLEEPENQQTVEDTVELSAAAKKQQERESGEAAENVENVDAWQAKHEDLYNQFLRLSADFENYKKRTVQEKESLLQYGAEKTMYELMPVLDNLERAATSLSDSSDPKILYQSFQLMQNQLMDAFSALGMKRIEAQGQPFDPHFHEAISQAPSEEYPEGTVINVMQAGYMLHDRVLRPSMVIVSSGSANAGAGSSEETTGTDQPSDNPFKIS